jgi:hypothetical protein
MAPSSIELAQLRERPEGLTDANANVQVAETTLQDTLPNGGYAWVCTFCVFMIIIHTWGINSAWGVVLDLATSYIIQHLGWRTAYKVLAGCSLGANLVSSLLLKTRKAQHNQQAHALDSRDLKRPEVLFVIF